MLLSESSCRHALPAPSRVGGDPLKAEDSGVDVRNGNYGLLASFPFQRTGRAMAV